MTVLLDESEHNVSWTFLIFPNPLIFNNVAFQRMGSLVFNCSYILLKKDDPNNIEASWGSKCQKSFVAFQNPEGRITSIGSSWSYTSNRSLTFATSKKIIMSSQTLFWRCCRRAMKLICMPKRKIELSMQTCSLHLYFWYTTQNFACFN